MRILKLSDKTEIIQKEVYANLQTRRGLLLE